jgi:hypothetical protein
LSRDLAGKFIDARRGTRHRKSFIDFDLATLQTLDVAVAVLDATRWENGTGFPGGSIS